MLLAPARVVDNAEVMRRAAQQKSQNQTTDQ